MDPSLNIHEGIYVHRQNCKFRTRENLHWMLDDSYILRDPKKLISGPAFWAIGYQTNIF